MEIRLSIYENLRASAEAENGDTYIFLCNECAEKRGTDVTYLESTDPDTPHYCEDCGTPNRAAEEEERRAAEAHSQDKPY